MRRRSSISITLAAGDPGKDLFAYLFLLVMVFSFMLLMSFNPSGSAQKAPDHDLNQDKSTQSSFALVTKDQVANLELKNSKLYLRFGNTLYDPIKQMAKLEEDQRIVTKKQGEMTLKILYIQKSDHDSISLFQYLETFKAFSRNNISIAFAVN